MKLGAIETGPTGPEAGRQKKGAAVSGGSKVNREASNRVDRSHSMSRSMDNMTNARESLTSCEDIRDFCAVPGSRRFTPFGCSICAYFWLLWVPLIWRGSHVVLDPAPTGGIAYVRPQIKSW